MRCKIYDNGFTIWLSARDTYLWATRPGSAWPCSQTSDRRIVAQFDSNGLCDFAIDDNDEEDIDSNELSALIADHMADRLPKDHICYDVAVGQFLPVQEGK